ncbi:phosphomannomutase/phosphoglucomutase [Microlunatus panaciterrae]|uniref:Phosphomannomutase n=1 Tax=Microlunatus panaciterrae TaxID=400768 RepID=A0ABS2RL94_9ACTN|nr:phosphomannomutase [Microlunatus panaciterrae]
MITRGVFKANDIRGIAVGPSPEWDADGAFAVGAALVDTLDLVAAEGALVLGRDMRVTSPEFAAAFARGVLSRGADVVDIGLASTDELWFASGRLGLPGAMFTASHNPASYNGVKFCLAGARPIASATLVEIADRAINDVPVTAPALGELSELDLLPAYADHLHTLVDLSGCRRLRVVADAGNGMAGHTLPAVLGSANVDLIGLYTDLDGTFPHHPPNPLEPENLRDAQAAVLEHQADLALVFDGDADRCFIIDERGEVVSPSVVTAMIASQELAREPGATIVRNTITSRAVSELVERLGGHIVTTRVGHTFVKAAMAEHDAIFGGEHSAHYYFRDFWGADTGMLAGLHVLALVGNSDKPLSELAGSYSRYVESGELNSVVVDTAQVTDAVAERFADRAALERLDGLTVAADDWWFNLRPSNTEPLLRLNVEAADHDTMVAVRDEVLAVIQDTARGPAVEQSPLL